MSPRVLKFGVFFAFQEGRSKVAALKAKYASSFDASSSKWIVITSINPPTSQVQKICNVKGWNKVVVGDKKSPNDWESAGCFFLSVQDQMELKYRSHDIIPYARYERKMLGYLLAIELGARTILGKLRNRLLLLLLRWQLLIVISAIVSCLKSLMSALAHAFDPTDTDDDNIPAATIPYVLETNDAGDVCADVVNRTTIAWNAYRHFGVPHLHNRGLPLRHVRPGQELEYEEAQYVRPLIQQGVVHCDPDLDAIQRLTMSPAYTSDVKFSETSTFLAFPPRCYHPINSQNTVFLSDAFWALLLPVTTLWREDDIFRGYWSQRLLWEVGGALVVTGPTAYQLRNPHDFFLDYRMEHNMYLHTERLLEYLNGWSCPAAATLSECIMRVMADLHAKGFIGKRDMLLSRSWVADLASIGYEFPARIEEGKWEAARRACPVAARLPKSFTDAIVPYSKEELQAVFEPVDCGAGA